MIRIVSGANIPRNLVGNKSTENHEAYRSSLVLSVCAWDVEDNLIFFFLSSSLNLFSLRGVASSHVTYHCSPTHKHRQYCSDYRAFEIKKTKTKKFHIFMYWFTFFLSLCVVVVVVFSIFVFVKMGVGERCLHAFRLLILILCIRIQLYFVDGRQPIRSI